MLPPFYNISYNFSKLTRYTFGKGYVGYAGASGAKGRLSSKHLFNPLTDSMTIGINQRAGVPFNQGYGVCSVRCITFEDEV